MCVVWGDMMKVLVVKKRVFGVVVRVREECVEVEIER